MEHYIYIGIILVIVSFLFVYWKQAESFFFNIRFNNIEDILEEINHQIKKKYRINKNDIKNTKVFYSETMPQKLKLFLNNVVKTVLDKINNMGNTNYNLINYETVIIQEGKEGSKRYLTDYFIYQTKDDIMIKLLIDFFEFNDNKLFVNSITISNDYINKCSLDNLDNHIKPKYKDIEDKTDLEYSYIKTTHYEISNSKKLFNPWIIPDEVENLYINGEKGWPCAKPSQEWDTNGIEKTQPSKEGRNCRGGYNYATKSRNIVPNQNPTVTGLSKDTKYSWLFNLFRGIPSFPTGSSLGSGSKNI